MTRPAAQVSIAFQTDKTPSAYGALAAAAEEYGFDGVSVFGDLMFQPPLPALLHMAATTRRVRLGAAGMNPYTVHPVEIAGQVAALDAASGGRAYAGFVAGAWLDRIGVAQRRPARALVDAVVIVRHLLAGNRDGYDGPVFRLDPGVALHYPVERAEVPVLVGAWGPKILGSAGRLADEVKLGGTANPAMVEVARARLGTPGVGIVLGAVTVVDEDGAAARRRARQEVALYLPVVAGLDPTVSVEADRLERMGSLVEERRAEEAAALVTDDLLDRFAFAGTPEQVADQALAIFAAGASRVEFGTPHGLSDTRGVELLGTRVLALIRAQVG